MRLIGLLLLIAILIVGWRAVTTNPVVYITGAQPPGHIAPAQPSSPMQAANSVAPSQEDCFAPKHDYNTSIPAALTVPDGPLLVASFFRPSDTERVAVLTPGTWHNTSGWTFGVTFDYPNCPLERVVAEANAHAARRGGSFLGVDVGFSR
jgi:hypothetical protein